MRASFPGPARSARGAFTLIELMVVIVIIAILMAISVAIVQGIVTRARSATTEGLVKMLSEACKLYRQDFDVYPPGQDSRALHSALGGPRRISMVKMQDGNIYTTKPPLIEFRAGQLEKGAPSLQPPPPSAIIDAWDQEIHYVNPGKHNKKEVDIWSDGPKKDKTEDDITNWIEP